MIDTDIKNVSLHKLFNKVVYGGYCIGCGACAAVQNSPISMYVDEYGCIQPKIDAKKSLPSVELEQICPFSGESDDENIIGRERFERSGINHDEHLGYYGGLFAGYVKEGEYREKGSSGGMATWCAAELFKQDKIDRLIHVHGRLPDNDDKRLFHYQISSSLDEICSNTKSQYYPIELSEVAQEVRRKPGRYAFVGIPCFVKAMRILMKHDPVIRERIKFCISLVCGHLKSMRWTEFLGWQVGIEPGTINRIGFREKAEDIRANDYYFSLSGKENGYDVTKKIQVWPMLSGDWSSGYFMYAACNYCDDVVGETADISVGDAWLPEYSGDPKGNNLLIVRNAFLLGLILAAKYQGRLHLDILTVGQAVASQAGGFRQRRDGLRYRLWLKKKAGEWCPRKRIEPCNTHLDLKRKHIFWLRMKIASLSHTEYLKAMQDGDLNSFVKRMTFISKWYKVVNRRILHDLMQRLQRIIVLAK